VKNRIWNHLHKEAQVRIEKLGRVWLSAALDAYSRSIVGLKVLKGAPDADSAVATLAMVAQHKDRLSALLGAQTSWPQCGTAEAVHTDAGAGYVAAKFELAVMMYTGRHRIPPSKHPHLRGRMERFFRTLNQRYIHLFSGQTFSNPLMKNEYDPEKYAHITDEEFADLIARLIVDCYHNTKHRGIGMTPLEAWYRGSQLARGAVLPPPSQRKYREIFGTTIKRSIGNDGINIAGNIYSSEKLLEIRKKWFRSKLWIRLNEEDISSISVKHRRRNNWIEVPAVFEGLKGVTLEEWKETVRYIDRRFGKDRQHSQEVVRDALAAAREVVRLSKQRPGVIVHKNLEEKLREIEAGIGPKFGYNQRQEYDYAQYDDGIDYDDLEEDDEELAAERMKRLIDEKSPPERWLPAVGAGANVLNPGAGMENFDSSRFSDEPARASAKNTSMKKPRTPRKSAAPASAVDFDGGQHDRGLARPANPDPAPRSSIRFTTNKEERK
jgi:putative transposase